MPQPSTKQPNINRTNPDSWKADTARSVEQYNQWFLDFAPRTFINAKEESARSVQSVFVQTNYLLDLSDSWLLAHGTAFKSLRQMCAPPIANDRLVGLSGVSSSVLKNLEDGKVPKQSALDYPSAVASLSNTLMHLLDPQLFPWIVEGRKPTEREEHVALIVVADRLCGADADPIIRNAQESRQLGKLDAWLTERGYTATEERNPFVMSKGTYAHHAIVNMFNNAQDDSDGMKKTPMDMVIMPPSGSPVFIECKSAGDYTNTNKRSKEEGEKQRKLAATYPGQRLNLFLC